MPLTPFVKPYEIVDDGDGDLSDVDLWAPRFRAEFPTGEVPIARVPALAPRERNIYEWGVELLARYEHAHEYDVEGLDQARSRLLVAVGECDWHTAHACVVELVRGGLTLKAIHRYTDVMASEVAWLYCFGSTTYRYTDALPLVEACEHLQLEPSRSRAAIAREFGLSPKTIYRLDRDLKWRDR